MSEKLNEKLNELEKKIEKKEQEVKELEKELEDKSPEVPSENSEDSSGKEEVKKIEESKKVEDEDIKKLKKRFKDTMAAYTRSRQELVALKAEVEVLKQELQKAIVSKLPEDKIRELDELKYNDPDAWRLKMNELEKTVASKTLDEIFHKAEQVKQEKIKEIENEIYTKFKEQHPDFDLNAVYDELPLGLIKKYEKGHIDFWTFLESAYTFHNSKDNIKQPPAPPKSVDLGAVGGSTEPSKSADSEDINELYSKAVF